MVDTDREKQTKYSGGPHGNTLKTQRVFIRRKWLKMSVSMGPQEARKLRTTFRLRPRT